LASLLAVDRVHAAQLPRGLMVCASQMPAMYVRACNEPDVTDSAFIATRGRILTGEVKSTNHREIGGKE
jgi:hypothetical protein